MKEAPNQQSGPGSDSIRDEIINIQNLSKQAGTAVTDEDLNQKTGSGSADGTREDSNKDIIIGWKKKYSEVGPRLGPILGEGQKRTRKQPDKSYNSRGPK